MAKVVATVLYNVHKMDEKQHKKGKIRKDKSHKKLLLLHLDSPASMTGEEQRRLEKWRRQNMASFGWWPKERKVAVEAVRVLP